MILLPFLLLLAGFLHPIQSMTQDLGRHILTGKIILQTHAVPKTNLFSYTYPDFPFINHHFGSEVVFALFEQTLGLQSLLFLTVIVVLAAFAIFVRYSYQKNIFPILIASVLYLPILFERTDVRPEIFSFLFLSIFIVVLYKNRTKFTQLIFILPLVELLWVNMHIYFFVGLAVTLLFLIDSLFTHRKNILNKHNRTLLLVLFLSFLSTLLNPNGLQGALYPFHVFQNYGYSVEENQNVFFLWNYFGGKTTILFFFISAIALFNALLFSFKKSRLIDWLMSFFFTILAILAERNFPLFVFGTFIPFVYTLSSFKLSFPHKYKHAKNIAIVIIVVLFIWQAKNITQAKGFGVGIEAGAKNAADFLIQNSIKGPIFNNFDIGSYLEYRLYPAERTFVDGRPEAYPVSFFQEIYIPMQQDPSVFENEDKHYRFNTIFFSHTDQTPWATEFLQQITKNKAWKMVYLDETAIIILKENNTNEQLIQRFILNESSFKLASDLKQNSLFRLARIFNLIEWKNQEANAYQKILAIDPNSCISLYNLSKILLEQKNPSASIYVNRFQYSCK